VGHWDFKGEGNITEREEMQTTIIKPEIARGGKKTARRWLDETGECTRKKQHKNEIPGRNF